jgi:hypothetical protein
MSPIDVIVSVDGRPNLMVDQSEQFPMVWDDISMESSQLHPSNIIILSMVVGPILDRPIGQFTMTSFQC